MSRKLSVLPLGPFFHLQILSVQFVTHCVALNQFLVSLSLISPKCKRSLPLLLQVTRWLFYWIYMWFRLTWQRTILHVLLLYSSFLWGLFTASFPQSCRLLAIFYMQLRVTHSPHLTQLNSSYLLPLIVSTVHAYPIIYGIIQFTTFISTVCCWKFYLKISIGR